MKASHDAKWLYAITSATGFRIYSLSDKKPKLVSTTLRTKSKLLIEPNYIGPIDGKPPKKNTVYDYDSPIHMEINKAETKAYISDRNHGFYIVDIRDKKHPKILQTIPSFKPDAFLLSDDDKYIILHMKRRLLRIETKALAEGKIPTYHNDTMHRTYMSYDRDKRRIIVSKDAQLMVYDANRLRFISTYTRIDNYGYKFMAVGDDNRIYAGIGANTIGVWQLQKDDLIAPVVKMSTAGFVESIVPLPGSDRFCYGERGGLTCVSLKDKLNPKRYIQYSDPGLNLAGTAVVVKDKLVIAYSHGGMGVVEMD
jgi:dipeptidyl aminopeptidase/acylaminoacyl peptidase